MTSKNKKLLEIISFSFLGIIVVVATFLFSYQIAHAQKIYKNVNFNAIDLSSKTKSQALALLQKNFSETLDTEFTLKAEQSELKAKLVDTGLTTDLDKTVSSAFAVGRNKHFFDQLYLSAKTIFTKETIMPEPSIDKEKYDNFIKIAVAQFNTDAQDAALTISNGQIVEVAGKSGLEIITDNLEQDILSLVDNGNKVIDLKYKVIEPQVKSADFADAKVSAERILSKKFTFNYENKTFIPNRGQIGNWITFPNQNGVIGVSLDQNDILAYLGQVAKDFEIVKKDKRINALDGSVIEEGREGKLLDKKSAYTQVLAGLNKEGDVNVMLATYAVPAGEVKIFPAEGLVPGRFPGKYVDIDLATQKLCRIEGSSVLDCYLISSGKPGMATPTGTYAINDKNPRHFSYKYQMWLPWWQRFITEGGYGIHELPETDTWKEPPDHLGTPVSHGCVRLGVGPAELVYSWTEIGTPVYIHK